eukprot:Rmarinus@m.7897
MALEVRWFLRSLLLVLYCFLECSCMKYDIAEAVRADSLEELGRYASWSAHDANSGDDIPYLSFSGTASVVGGLHGDESIVVAFINEDLNVNMTSGFWCGNPELPDMDLTFARFSVTPDIVSVEVDHIVTDSGIFALWVGLCAGSVTWAAKVEGQMVTRFSYGYLPPGFYPLLDFYSIWFYVPLCGIFAGLVFEVFDRFRPKKFVRMAYVHPLNVLLCVSCLLNMLAVDERERYLEKSNLDGNWEDSIPFFSSLHLAFFLIICAQILHIYHITDGMRGRRDSKILFQVTGFALAAVFPIVILLESYSLGFVLLYPIFCAWWMETITFRAATRGFLYWPYFLSTGTVVVLVLVMYFNEAPYRWNDWTFRVTYDVIMTVFVILLYPLLWTSFRMGSYTDVAILPPAAPALPLIAEKPTGHGDTPVVEVNIRPNSLAWDLLQMKSTTTLAAGDLRMQSSDGACFIIPYYLGQCRSSEIRLSVLFNDTYSPGALPTVFVPGGSEAVGCVAYFLVHDRLPLTPPLPGRVVDESESREFTKSNEWLRGIHPMTRSDGSSTTLSRGMSSRRPSFRSVHDGDTSGRRGLGRRRSSGRLSGALWLGRVAREHVAPTSLVSSTDDVSPRTESTLALETLVQVYLAAAKLVVQM